MTPTPGTAAPPMRCFKTSTSSRATRRVVVLAGDHIYKMDYEVMLRQHVESDDPQRDAQRFRRTDKGVCLITQAMLDRLGT